MILVETKVAFIIYWYIFLKIWDNIIFLEPLTSLFTAKFIYLYGNPASSWIIAKWPVAFDVKWKNLKLTFSLVDTLKTQIHVANFRPSLVQYEWINSTSVGRIGRISSFCRWQIVVQTFLPIWVYSMFLTVLQVDSVQVSHKCLVKLSRNSPPIILKIKF